MKKSYLIVVIVSVVLMSLASVGEASVAISSTQLPLAGAASTGARIDNSRNSRYFTHATMTNRL